MFSNLFNDHQVFNWKTAINALITIVVIYWEWTCEGVQRFPWQIQNSITKPRINSKLNRTKLNPTRGISFELTAVRRISTINDQNIRPQPIFTQMEWTRQTSSNINFIFIAHIIYCLRPNAFSNQTADIVFVLSGNKFPFCARTRIKWICAGTYFAWYMSDRKKKIRQSPNSTQWYLLKFWLAMYARFTRDSFVNGKMPSEAIGGSIDVLLGAHRNRCEKYRKGLDEQ